MIPAIIPRFSFESFVYRVLASTSRLAEPLESSYSDASISLELVVVSRSSRENSLGVGALVVGVGAFVVALGASVVGTGGGEVVGSVMLGPLSPGPMFTGGITGLVSSSPR